MTPALYERSLLEDLAPLEGPNATRDLSTADPTEPDSYRLAFADPEFMARRETRGIRFTSGTAQTRFGPASHGH